jgi:hypothetical protein
MESLGIKGQKWRDETRREKNRSREGRGGSREPNTVKKLKKGKGRILYFLNKFYKRKGERGKDRVSFC